MSIRRLFILVTSVAAATAFAGTADAKILCDGPYQVSGGNYLPTPYCEDNDLAAIARGYGMSVSGAEIRHNYNAKKRVCQVIGHDTRVSQICIGVRPEGNRKLLVP
jgi:hypothetical protein